MLDVNYKEFYAELEELFGEGARTYLFIADNGRQTRYLCIPGEDHRPLTDEENRQYNALVARMTRDTETLIGEVASAITSGRVHG